METSYKEGDVVQGVRSGHIYKINKIYKFNGRQMAAKAIVLSHGDVCRPMGSSFDLNLRAELKLIKNNQHPHTTIFK